MARAQTSLPPGFRFHPTDVELVSYYLKRRIMRKRLLVEAITEIELYKYAPWDLPDKSCIRSKDLEWYFFCPRDKKYLNGSRTNRATPNGYWKTTGKDRTIVLNSRTVGMKKTLIFHEGKAPKGGRTDWVMYEYRMEDNDLVVAGFSKDAYVLCKIFQKSGLGPRIGEQYGAPFDEEEWENVDTETAVLPLMSCPSSGLVNAVEQPPIHHTVAANAVEEQPALHPAVASAIEELPFEHTVAAGADEEPSSQDTLKSSGYKVVSANHTSAVNVYDPPEFDGIFLEELASLLNDSPYCDSASAELAVLPAIPEAEAQALQMNSDDIYNELAELVDLGHVPAANDPCPNYTYA